MDKYAQQLSESFFIRRNVVASVIGEMKISPGSSGLDAGCGIGLPALMLAEETGSEGHITGLDISPELLIHAKEITVKSGRKEYIDYIAGDINKLPFNDNTFDWVWSMDGSDTVL